MSVREEMWSILAKYLCGEATTSESLIVELLLKENEELRKFYQTMELAYLLNESKANSDTIIAFAKLDERIKKSRTSGR